MAKKRRLVVLLFLVLFPILLNLNSVLALNPLPTIGPNCKNVMTIESAVYGCPGHSGIPDPLYKWTPICNEMDPASPDYENNCCSNLPNDKEWRNADVTQLAADACNGKSSCKISALYDRFRGPDSIVQIGDPAYDCYKGMTVKFKCDICGSAIVK